MGNPLYYPKAEDIARADLVVTDSPVERKLFATDARMGRSRPIIGDGLTPPDIGINAAGAGRAPALNQREQMVTAGLRSEGARFIAQGARR